MRKLAILIPMLLILMLGQPVSASIIDSTDGSGWYQLTGATWSGVGVDGKGGFCIGVGRWFSLGKSPHLFLITPMTMQVGLGSDDKEDGLIGFNPQMAMKIGRVILTVGSGISKYYADHGVTTYAQLDGSLTVILSDMKWFNSELTLAARYLPGNRMKTIILGLTVID